MGVAGSGGARPGGRHHCVNRASAVGRLSRDRPHDPRVRVPSDVYGQSSELW